jgi:ATP-dependent DNA ligase
VIGGFTDPAGSRVGFGALLVAYYDRGKLRYAGKVGTGFDTALLVRLRRRLDARVMGRSPFAQDVREKGVHWVKPDLVAQIGFTEWTHDGKLRHPRFLGLRTDKPARDVVRERPQAIKPDLLHRKPLPPVTGKRSLSDVLADLRADER